MPVIEPEARFRFDLARWWGELSDGGAEVFESVPAAQPKGGGFAVIRDHGLRTP
jgi:hypothetical protein